MQNNGFFLKKSSLYYGELEYICSEKKTCHYVF